MCLSQNIGLKRDVVLEEMKTARALRGVYCLLQYSTQFFSSWLCFVC